MSLNHRIRALLGESMDCVRAATHKITCVMSALYDGGLDKHQMHTVLNEALMELDKID